MITNYLIELLNDHECVVVPEFGAFISKRHSATIDYATHRFMPPYKEVAFNKMLSNNDGLLVGMIAEKEHISEELALAKIQNFVNQSVAILDVNFELELQGLGKFININGNYIFKEKEDVNVLGDSFGLSEFNYQPVFRTETYQIIKEKIVVEQTQKNTEYTIAIETADDNVSTRKRPRIFKTLAYTMVAFLLLFVINWRTEKDTNLASWNPFLYSSPNEFLAGILPETENVVSETEIIEVSETELVETLVSQDIETTEIDDVALETEIVEPLMTESVEVLEIQDVESVETYDVVVETEIVETSKIETIVLDPHYYIVGGSFKTEESAETCLDILKKQGFEYAAILDKNEKGYIRVYYESFVEKDDALPRLDAIKREYNEAAWLLFQK